MTKSTNQPVRCAIYTRKSSEEGLEQSFNSLHAQREACEAYIKSQQHEGWRLLPDNYDDGGFSGGNMERPALNALITAIKQGEVDIIVVYKVDRLSRSLADFVRMVELFDQHKVSFVSVTQQFNTSSSMGRLTLNVLLSFAQFEREVTGERIRDKIAASKQKGMWMGGVVPLGYDAIDRALVINETEATIVQHIYERYLALGCVRRLKQELDSKGYVSKARETNGRKTGGKPFSRGALYTILKNPLYIGKVSHKGIHHKGQHDSILNKKLWKQVQERLANNRQQRASRIGTGEVSLLAGLLFDDRGNPMSPTHANSNNRRYRYYISQAIPQYRDSEAGSVSRISASTIENLASTRFKELLKTETTLSEIVLEQPHDAASYKTLITNARSLEVKWDSLSPPGKRDYIITILSKITVSRDKVQIAFSRSGMTKILLPTSEYTCNPASDDYCITIAARLKRCGIESRLVITDSSPERAHPKTVKAIQEALSKALEWNNCLISGKSSSMTEIAKENGVTQRYVAHLIKLAWLAPDIVQAIFSGEISEELSLDRLKKGFPAEWQEQRKSLGLGSHQ